MKKIRSFAFWALKSENLDWILQEFAQVAKKFVLFKKCTVNGRTCIVEWTSLNCIKKTVLTVRSTLIRLVHEQQCKYKIHFKIIWKKANNLFCL